MNNSKLTVPEILMLHYADTFHEGDNIFQQFWKYRYNVHPDEILSELLYNNYIEIGNFESALKRKTMPELKAFLKENNFPISGKKQDLIFRILNNCDDNTLEKFCAPRNYALTAKGKEIVAGHPNVLYAHRHIDYNLSDKEIFDTSADIKEIAYNKIFKQFKYNVKNNQWGLARNDVYTLANIAEESERYKEALKFLVVGICIDISGVTDEYAIKHNIMTPGENYCCTIYPFSIVRLSKIVDLLIMPVEIFIKECVVIIDDLNLPYSYYDKSTIKEMLINNFLEYTDETIRYSSCSNQ